MIDTEHFYALRSKPLRDTLKDALHFEVWYHVVRNMRIPIIDRLERNLWRGLSRQLEGEELT